MNTSYKGYTLVELMVALTVSATVLATTIQLGRHWVEQAKISNSDGELTQGIGKAISIAVRNEQALDSLSPVSALCRSETNQLSVLKANTTELPNCASREGTAVWASSIPDDIDITANGVDMECLCFNAYGLQTTNSCGSCTTTTVLSVSAGSSETTLYIR